jgi:dipeptidyl-peptidase-3
MKKFINLLFIVLIFNSCKQEMTSETDTSGEFSYVLEQFADLRILQYQVPGFNDLTLKQKELIYYLSEAAICGRDILFDQNGRYNLLIRKNLENLYSSYKGDKTSGNWKKFEVYLKRIWFSNGIYHHYSNDKFIPDFDEGYFNELIHESDKDGFVLLDGKNLEETIQLLKKIIFDKNFEPKKITLDSSKDIIAGSAVNFYGERVTQEDVESFYAGIRDEKDNTPVSYGLNSKVILTNGKVEEKVYKLSGLYGQAIEKIVHWLEKAVKVAETPEQKEGLQKLISYYKSGNLETWDEYNVLWVKDLESRVDFINGFIEVYNDPIGMKATWESVVNYKNIEATKRTEIISSNAQWFEDNSPIDDRFKKPEVKGVTAKVIDVAMLGGDCYPATPIGINLPNADWIRRDHGSKSVTLDNITYAYAQANLTSGFLEEFSLTEEDMERERKYGPLSDNLHTDLHECLGHGSGQLLPGVSSEALRNYHSPLEETRADLFALYYILDPKMIEIGLLPSLDAAKAQYLSYIRNGLMTQLRRIEPGKNIEQAHMRNRQLISKWCYEKGQAENVIELIRKDEKTYIKINDFARLRQLFGELLKEVQRIKSEGDYEAGKILVETYGVKVDEDLHQEVIERFKELDIAAYSGFINPVYNTVMENGQLVDIEISYNEDYTKQMLRYSRDYSFLPVEN